MTRMAEAPPYPVVTSAGPRRSARRGFVLGVVVTLVVLLAVWQAKQVFSPAPRTVSATCSGANVTATIWLADAGIYISVTVADPQGRSWDVAWGAFAEEVRGSVMTSSVDADYSGSVVGATQSLGDLDDGTHRTAQVRPHGTKTWCDLDMHVWWFW